MTDKLKETVSAFIDGEASEIEIHRLLRQMDGDASVKPSWIRYLQVRSVIQGERRVPVDRHLELHERISLAIRDEDTYALKSGAKAPVLRTFAKPIAGLAVAASLAMVVMVGYYVQSPGTPGEMTASAPVGVSPQAISVQPVSTASVPQAGSAPMQPMDLRQLDEQQQRELRAYLNMHDQMARMDPNAQMVIYDNPNTSNE